MTPLAAALPLLLAAVGPPAPAAVVSPPDGAWRIELFARAVAPGEPVRVVASADLAVRFLGEAVTLSPGTTPGQWVGWAAVPLNAPAGPGEVQAGGHKATITVEGRDFPEQRLQVKSRYVEPPPAVARRIESERARLTALWKERARPSTPPQPFVRPVPGAPTGIFGERRFFNGQARAPHPGLDLKAAVGTRVLAAGAGRVVLAGDLYWTGGTVVLDHGDGLFTVYAHLSKVEVKEGGVVAAGALVGRSGATGRVTGPHLHWGAKIGDVPVDPRALLDARLFP